MIYFNKKEKRLVSEHEVVTENPNTSFPRPFSDETLSGLGLVHFAKDPQPACDTETHYIIEGPIEIRDGVAYLTYNTKKHDSMTLRKNLQKKKQEVRAVRNKLLADSDWAVLPDSQLAEDVKQDWMVYRQELRDFTDAVDFPYTELWPEDPIEDYGDGVI